MADRENTLANYFSFIEKENHIITVKVDLRSYVDYERPLTDELVCEEMWEIVYEGHWNLAHAYIQQLGYTVIASSVGMHLKGKNGNPHIHFHFVIKQPFQVLTSKHSMIKTRYVKTLEPPEYLLFKQMSWKHMPIDDKKPLWCILSYPFKEKIRGPKEMYCLAGSDFIPYEIIELLELVGSDIYQSSVAQSERNEKSQQRKSEDLEELLQVAVKNRSAFKNFQQMQCWFDTVYLRKLAHHEGIHSLPDIVNFNKNLKKIGYMLNLFEYRQDPSARFDEF